MTDYKSAAEERKERIFDKCPCGRTSSLIKALKQEDGITRVIREDREILLVATPTWSIDRLQEWVARYLQDNIRDLRPV